MNVEHKAPRHHSQMRYPPADHPIRLSSLTVNGGEGKDLRSCAKAQFQLAAVDTLCETSALLASSVVKNVVNTLAQTFLVTH